MLDAEPDGGERVLDLVGDLPRHFTPGQHARRARQRGRVVQRHDAAVGGGARSQRGELHPDLAPGDLEFALDDVRRPR